MLHLRISSTGYFDGFEEFDGEEELSFFTELEGVVVSDDEDDESTDFASLPPSEPWVSSAGLSRPGLFP